MQSRFDAGQDRTGLVMKEERRIAQTTNTEEEVGTHGSYTLLLWLPANQFGATLQLHPMP
jgi:hypothetical protein